jgi:hypothetical protein
MSIRALKAASFAALAALFCIQADAVMAADMSPEMKALAAAADKEGQLNILAADTVMGGAENWKAVETGMNAMFGTHIKVRYTPGPAILNEGYQIIQEFKAGRKSSSDLYSGPTQIVLAMTDENMLNTTDWKALMPGRVTDDMIEENGTVLRWQSFARGVIYNTKLLPNPPTTLAGYLDPSL